MQAEATKAVIEKFGGISALARHLGHANPTTVHGWSKRGRIPSAQIPNVMKAATDLNIALTYKDFFDDSEAA